MTLPDTTKPLTSDMQLTEEQVEQAISEYVTRQTGCGVDTVMVNYINERIVTTVRLVHGDKQGRDTALDNYRTCATQMASDLRDYYHEHENYSDLVALHKTREFIYKVTGENSVKNLDQYQCQLLMSAIHAEFAANLEPNNKQEPAK